MLDSWLIEKLREQEERQREAVRPRVTQVVWDEPGSDVKPEVPRGVCVVDFSL